MPGLWTAKRVVKSFTPAWLYLINAQYSYWMDHSKLCNVLTEPSCLLFVPKPTVPRIHLSNETFNSTTNLYPETEVAITIKHNGSVPQFWSGNDTKGTFIIQDHGEHIDFWHSTTAKMPIVVKQWTGQQEIKAAQDAEHPEEPAPTSSTTVSKARNECITSICKAWHFVCQFKSPIWWVCSSLLFELLFRYLLLSRIWVHTIGRIPYFRRRRGIAEQHLQPSNDSVSTTDTPTLSITQDQTARIQQLVQREALLQSFFQTHMISRRHEYIRAVVLQNWKSAFLSEKRRAEASRAASLEIQNSDFDLINNGRRNRILSLDRQLNDTNGRLAAFTKREVGLNKRLAESRRKIGKQKASKEKAQEDAQEMKNRAEAAEKSADAL
ncbi:MAG: hypothetical protein Q9217_002761 [Psora testacea]